MRTTSFAAVVLALCAATAFGSGGGTTAPSAPPNSQPAAARVLGDLDDDGKVDLVVFRPDTATWYIAYSTNGYSTTEAIQWGLPGDVPVTALNPANGSPTRGLLGVFRHGLWARMGEREPFRKGLLESFDWGDLPVPGDYDADGYTDYGLYKPDPYPEDRSGLVWRVVLSTRNCAMIDVPNGTCAVVMYRNDFTTDRSLRRSEIPVPAAYHGGGRTLPALYDYLTGRWQICILDTYSVTTSGPHYFCQEDERMTPARGIPAPADYDGDGLADVAVWLGDPFAVTPVWFAHLSASNTDVTVTFGEAGDVPIAGDYDGDGRADMALFRPSNGTVYINTAANNFAPTSTYAFGQAGDIWAVSGISSYTSGAVRARNDLLARTDVDGDTFSDMTVYRPETSEWLTLQSAPDKSTWSTLPDALGWTRWSYRLWGEPGDLPVPGDYVGRGRTEPAVFNPSTGMWSFAATTIGGQNRTVFIQWGLPGDIPVPGDYDGNGQMDLAVYRPADHGWYVLFLVNRYFTFESTAFVQWGLDGDIPVPADYNGDGKTDMAVFRPVNGTWYILQSSETNAFLPLELQFGLEGDIPVPGDYFGSGRAQVAVYRPSAGYWYAFPDRVRHIQWGMPGDIPVLGDYDGDRRLDRTVYRPSTGEWFVLMSRSNFRTYFIRQWGMPGDIPLPQPR